MLARIVSTCGAAALALVALAAPAPAGDYSDQCATADGEYVMQDGKLYEAAALRSGQSKEIGYRKLGEIVLSHTKGYCVGTNDAGRGKRFEYEAKDYVISVELAGADGQKVTTRLLCALDADGTPASVTCGPAVVTSRQTLVPAYKN